MTPEEAEEILKDVLCAVSATYKFFPNGGRRHGFSVNWGDYRHAYLGGDRESLESVTQATMAALLDWIARKRDNR